MAAMFELMAQVIQVLVAAAAVGIAVFGLRFFAVKLQNALLEPQKKIFSREIYIVYLYQHGGAFFQVHQQFLTQSL